MQRLPLAVLSTIIASAAIATPSWLYGEEGDLQGRSELMAEIDGLLDAESWERAESSIERFRSLYPPSSRVRSWENGNEVVYLFPATLRLATHYQRLGDLEKVLALYDAELGALSPDVPHYSWGLVGLRVPILLELGAASAVQIRGDLEEHRDLFARKAAEVDNPGRRDLFEGLASRMTSALHHLELIGRPAPAFDFVRAYNATLPASLHDYLGQVLVIDFWATWCPPCMAAWPELQELYGTYHDEGLEILGVTSVEGSYGTETPEREVELTERLIEEHGIEWPILFSNRPVNDPQYATTTLPSYAIIDRDGHVERILVGGFDGLGERIVERLLAVETTSAE